MMDKQTREAAKLICKLLDTPVKYNEYWFKIYIDDAWLDRIKSNHTTLIEIINKGGIVHSLYKMAGRSDWKFNQYHINNEAHLYFLRSLYKAMGKTNGRK